MTDKLDFPVFDSDNHLYETQDAFLRHLPAQYKGAIRYVEVDGRTKIAIKGQHQRLHPQPHLRGGGQAGGLPGLRTGNNPDGRTLREITGEPMRSIPAFLDPEARLEVLDGFGIDGTLLFPTLASVLEVNLTDDPELALAAIHSFNQWLHETWTFDYRGPDLRHPGHQPLDLRGRHRRARVGARARRQGDPGPPGGGRRLPGPPLARSWPSSTRSGPGSKSRHPDHPAPLGQRLHPLRQRVGRGGGRRVAALHPSAFQTLSVGHRPIIRRHLLDRGPRHAEPVPRRQGGQRRERERWVPRVLEDFRSVHYGRCPRSSPRTRSRSSTARSGSTRSGRTRSTSWSSCSGRKRSCSARTGPTAECLDEPLSWVDYCAKPGVGRDDVAKMMGANLSGLMGVTPAVA